jgi:SOS response associated peptidase (SRAP)
MRFDRFFIPLDPYSRYVGYVQEPVLDLVGHLENGVSPVASDLGDERHASSLPCDGILAPALSHIDRSSTEPPNSPISKGTLTKKGKWLLAGDAESNACTAGGLQILVASLPANATSRAMRGRYTHKLTWAEIVKLYQLTLPDQEPAGFKPSYNVAPTDVMPIIRPHGNGRELMMAGWGLIPYWLKPGALKQRAFSTINARAETIGTAPTYREPFAKRRCLVPATG